MTVNSEVISISWFLTIQLRSQSRQHAVFSGLELYPDMKRIAMAIVVILFGVGGGTVFGQTVRVPFDFSQSEIGVDATVNGEPRERILVPFWGMSATSFLHP